MSLLEIVFIGEIGLGFNTGMSSLGASIIQCLSDDTAFKSIRLHLPKDDHQYETEPNQAYDFINDKGSLTWEDFLAREGMFTDDVVVDEKKDNDVDAGNDNIYDIGFDSWDDPTNLDFNPRKTYRTRKHLDELDPLYAVPYKPSKDSIEKSEGTLAEYSIDDVDTEDDDDICSALKLAEAVWKIIPKHVKKKMRLKYGGNIKKTYMDYLKDNKHPNFDIDIATVNQFLCKYHYKLTSSDEKGSMEFLSLNIPGTPKMVSSAMFRNYLCEHVLT